jgi:CRP/FNR family transcriptional regulator, anaerobic regulatory protein
MNPPLRILKKTARCRNCAERAGTLCAILSCEQLDRLEAIMTPVSIEPGQVIFTEGDELGHYFNIAAGVIRLVKLLPDGRRVVLDFLFKGDFLGLNAKGRYAYTAEAATAVRLCRFPRAKLKALFKEIPAIESQLLNLFADKLEAAQERIVELAQKAPDRRLAAFLLRLAEKDALKTKDGVLVLPMGREDIAAFLGLTLWTVSRAFSRLEKGGLIRLESPKKVRFENPRGLRELAEDARPAPSMWNVRKQPQP